MNKFKAFTDEELDSIGSWISAHDPHRSHRGLCEDEIYPCGPGCESPVLCDTLMEEWSKERCNRPSFKAAQRRIYPELYKREKKKREKK